MYVAPAYFLLLQWSITAIVAALGVSLFLKTRNIEFVAGFILLYYFSIHGGFIVLSVKNGSQIHEGLQHLEKALFPIYTDSFYFIALLLYGLFVITIGLILLIGVKVPAPLPTAETAYALSIKRLLSLGVISLIASFAIVGPSIIGGIESGTSGYLATRTGHASEWFTIHQLLNRIGLIALMFAASILLSGNRPRILRADTSNWAIKLACAICIAAAFGYFLLLGNKNELLFAGMAAVFLYMRNVARPNYGKFFLAAFFGIFSLRIIDMTRGTSPAMLWDLLSRHELIELIDITSYASGVSEVVAAHISMYGALSHNIPLTYGSSFLYIAASIFPSILGMDRPETIYDHYVNSVSALPGQGYTLHQATGWYLNFGVAGTFLGAIVFGTIWLFLWNRSQASRSDWGRILSTILCCFFVAFIPALLRSGPEAYKALLVEAMLTPCLILWFCAIPRITERIQDK